MSQAQPTDDPKLRCPRDASVMEKITVGSTVVDHCARCGGMWFDAYELQVVLNSKKAVEIIDYGTIKQTTGAAVLRSGTLRCPRDENEMALVPDPRQPHVMIDLCKSCGGVFLDAGELKDLSEFTVAERLRAFLRRS